MTKEEVLEKIDNSNHTERCKLAMKAAVDVLVKRNYKLDFHDFGDIVHLADAWDQDSIPEIRSKLRGLGVRWREQSESYTYYVPE